MCNEIAMTTAETTNSNMLQKLAKTVAYDAVRQGVAAELKEFLNRDGFVDMFDYVINLGGSTAPFIPKLVTFTRAWVNWDFLSGCH